MVLQLSQCLEVRADHQHAAWDLFADLEQGLSQFSVDIQRIFTEIFESEIEAMALQVFLGDVERDLLLGYDMLVDQFNRRLNGQLALPGIQRGEGS